MNLLPILQHPYSYERFVYHRSSSLMQERQSISIAYNSNFHPFPSRRLYAWFQHQREFFRVYFCENSGKKYN